MQFFQTLVVLSLMPLSASAAMVTIDYSGHIDLSVIGGGTDTAFSGSYSYDDAVAGGGLHPTSYPLMPQTRLTIGGIEISGTSFPDQTQQGVLYIWNDTFGTGDLYEFFAPLHSGQVGLDFLGRNLTSVGFGLFDYQGSMFNDESLPSDVAFLHEVDASIFRLIFSDMYLDRLTVDGQLDFVGVSAVPIPAGGWLLLSGLGALGYTGWRRNCEACFISEGRQ